MIKVILLLTIVAIPFLLLRLLNNKKSQRRQGLAELRLNDGQREALAKDYPLYAKLPEDLKHDLEGLIHVFIAEKAFKPCGGLEEVTPHMQRVIAAQACILLLRMPHNLYSKLRTILLYPDTYVATAENGEISVRLGESWGTGSVVLSWASVISGGRNTKDGHNVTIHELAHQLDQEDGAADGVPELQSRGAYKEWASIMHPEFKTLVTRSEKGKPSVLDSYGAVNPAEFFAVSTETFYEKPEQLKEQHPKLYDLLSNYYGVSPIEWL